jgi:hypothetical protein
LLENIGSYKNNMELKHLANLYLIAIISALFILMVEGKNRLRVGAAPGC